MQQERFIFLLSQYKAGILTEEERRELLEATGAENQEDLFSQIEHLAETDSLQMKEFPVAQLERAFKNVVAIDKTTVQDEVIPEPVARPRLRFLQPYIWKTAAAAAILILIAGGTYLIFNRSKEKPAIATAHYKGDVEPGHNGAVLRLSNGNMVVLDSVQDGTVATQGTVQAVKVNGQLSYVGKTSEDLYNTVSTERGRQWQLMLPDGTKVWLNAASSVRYPLTFFGTERIVEVTGEAYFEVVHNSKQPFKVKAGNQVIEDIGTAFNVNAYSDEPSKKTTLVEGAVSVNGVTLQPGEQAVLKNSHVSVSAANINQALAWKNGFFGFDHADIQSVMRQLSRWYNVEVKFEGVPENTSFQGKIDRRLTLAQVLNVLEQVHVHFRIEEDKRIVILP